MISFHGKCSEFGGIHDRVMEKDSGLALYEPKEADKRPDLFYGEHHWPYDNGKVEAYPTWKRLKIDAFYIAMRFEEFIDEKSVTRRKIQSIPFCIKNPLNGLYCVGFLVDRGPGIKDRIVDLSPGIIKFLNLRTDDEVEVTMLDLPQNI